MNWQIAILVFFGLGTILLMVVFIWTLNTMLRKQLGHNPSVLKVALGVALLVLSGLLVSMVALGCYVYWMGADDGQDSSLTTYYNLLSAVNYIRVVFWALFMISLLASGAVSLLAVRSLRKNHVALGVRTLLVDRLKMLWLTHQ